MKAETPAPASPHDAPPRHLVILGSTGSIGRQAIDVLPHVPNVRLVGLAAHNQAVAVLEQAAATGAAAVALRDPAAASEAAARADIGLAADVRLYGDEAGVNELIHDAAEEARLEGAELTVLNGIVGAAGLRATITALEHGATLALANKESMVAGGPFVLAAARASGAAIIPVDSEHSALFQCMLGGTDEVSELLLTGSGGPFRLSTDEELARATPGQALRHPTWTMGPKITIDSATLMNKGLEVIEAHYLFGVPYERITVLINPQSVVHSMVRFKDGAVLAHLGMPDMRVPIAYALAWPDGRPALPMVPRLDIFGDISFTKPDTERFRCLKLAIDAGKRAAAAEKEAAAVRTLAAPVVLNAANEIAVHSFLDGQIAFNSIADVVEKCLSLLGDEPVESLGDVFDCDREARRFAREAVRQTK